MHRFTLVAIAGALLLPVLCQASPVTAADASAIRAVIDRQRMHESARHGSLRRGHDP
jgi:hypothetical protein